MENEARRRAQVLSSHNIEEFRAFLKEKANDPAPQPASYRMGGIVRAVFPQLSYYEKGDTRSKCWSMFLKRTA